MSVEQVPRRIEAIKEELDSAAADYVQSKDWYEEARVKFESARERLASVRRLATSILTTVDFYTWQGEHPDVRYAAIPIADAILAVLRNHAYLKAWEVAEAKEKSQIIAYTPRMGLASIVQELEAGGFEFRTTSANREVNAALLNLSGVDKPTEGFYQIEDAKEILALYIGAEEQAKTE